MKSPSDDTRGQAASRPARTLALAGLIGAVGVVLTHFSDIETIQPSPTRPTRFEYLQAHPESLLYSALITLCLVAVIHYAANVHRWGEPDDE